MSIYHESSDFFAALPKDIKHYKLLGMDVGVKKIGMAVYNSQVQVVIPTRTMQRSTLKQDLKEIIAMIDNDRIHGLVIGLPIAKHGQSEPPNPLLAYITRFGEEIAKQIKLPIIFVDESFSSKLAHAILRETNLSRKKRDEVDDQMAATIILEDFIRRKEFK